MKRHIILSALLLCCNVLPAQKATRYTTTQEVTWQESRSSLSRKAEGKTLLTLNGGEKGTEFRGWGTTFNELDWDAFNLLTREEQDELMRRIYAPDGDLRFTLGRVSMNANDYARAWYSCSEVPGDFELRHFNIQHDLQNIIPLARAAQKYCPGLELFMSPWSPPTWMKINHDYPVQPAPTNKMDARQAYLLFMDDGRDRDPDEMKLLGDRNGVFPKRLASQDFFIQDPRYLQAYADMFCRFIDLYKEQGLPITKVMYQNEAYSYTPYPGCAWTAEGTLRFNNEYLAPTLQRKHPEVELWIGTINTNRLDYVQKILDDKTLQQNVKGIGTQWECRNNLPQLRERYPQLRVMCSESECGNGQMDWRAAEHTFWLLSDNLGHGVDEYYNWNFILTDQGQSPWGWKQNALVQVKSADRSVRYTPEFYAYKHFSHFVAPGTRMVAYAGREHAKTPVVVFRTGKGYVVTAGNLTDQAVTCNVQLEGKYLNMNLPAHSFSTWKI